MDYTVYDTADGMVKVYRDAGYEYYLDVDNRYDLTFDTKQEFDSYLKRVKAILVGYDHD